MCQTNQPRTRHRVGRNKLRAVPAAVLFNPFRSASPKRDIGIGWLADEPERVPSTALGARCTRPQPPQYSTLAKHWFRTRSEATERAE